MVFSSVPLYLDPPNWPQQQVQQHHQQHQQQQQQQQICHNNSNQHEQNQQHQLIQLPPSQVPPQPHQMGMLNGSGGGSGGGVGPQIRANSMSERARLAKIPPPEVPLKCPRCESSNTKFCYYNNYSLTQPRHFCKTCRRYWTRGGALRNVPVGGGCRRNKRTSSNNNSNNNKSSSSGCGGGGGGGCAMSSKSSLSLTPQSTMVTGDHHLLSDSRGINVNSLSGSGNGMSFMASLQNIAQLGGMSNNMMSNIAQLAFSPNSNTTPLGGTGVGAGAGAGAGAGYNIGFPQQQQQQVQFPNFLGGFEIPGSSEGTGGLYSTLFQNIQHRHSNNNNNNDQGIENGNEVEENQPQELLNVNNMSKSCSSTSMVTPIKMEDNNNNNNNNGQQQQQQGLNLAKQLMMGISSSTNNNHNHNHNHNNILSRNIINNSNSNSNNNPFWGGTMTNGAAAITSMWTDLSGLNSSSTTHLL